MCKNIPAIYPCNCNDFSSWEILGALRNPIFCAVQPHFLRCVTPMAVKNLTNLHKWLFLSSLLCNRIKFKVFISTFIQCSKNYLFRIRQNCGGKQRPPFWRTLRFDEWTVPGKNNHWARKAQTKISCKSLLSTNNQERTGSCRKDGGEISAIQRCL